MFNACLVLAKLGDLEAVDAILKVLKEHKDPYGRVAAANAIGSLHACDGVMGLVQAFLDKDESVVLSAAQGFSKITGQDTGLSGSPSRKDKTEAKEKWGKWWHEHETEVRTRWKQPVQAPGAPPVPAPAPGSRPAAGPQVGCPRRSRPGGPAPEGGSRHPAFPEWGPARGPEMPDGDPVLRSLP